MATSIIQRDIEDALNELRNAVFYHNTSRENQLKRILINFLKPAGYTVVPDPKEFYIIRQSAGKLK